MGITYDHDMGNMDEKYGGYKVPHNGQRFEENGKVYYWNFADSAVGTLVDRVDRAYREDMGGRFGVRIHVQAVEKRQTPQGTIVKWEVLEGHGTETRGDPNPESGIKPGADISPDWATYQSMYGIMDNDNR
jgi:hypothetical protein